MEWSGILLPGEFHGQRSLAGYSPWSCKESDTTEGLTLSLSLRIQNSRPNLRPTESESTKENLMMANFFYQKLEKSSLNFSETEVQVRMRKTILANHSLKH